MALRSRQGLDGSIDSSQGFGHSRLQCRVAIFIPWRLTVLATLLLPILCGIPTFVSAQEQLADPLVTSFYFTSFNASSNTMTYLRDAFVDNDQVYLTSKEISIPTEDDIIVPLSHGIGRVFYAQPIRGRNPVTGAPTSFSTTFIFSIANPQQLQVGDGLAFLIAANDSVVGSGGMYLGVLDQSSNGLPSARTFAVEFDTWQNPELLDPDANHVGVDVDSMISQQASTAGFWGDDNAFHFFPLTGLTLQAWIDFSNDDGQIQVSVSPLLGNKPPRPLLSLEIDLTGVMEDEMYVGFAAATGDLSAEHIVHAWSFNTSGSARDFQFGSGSGSHKQLLIRSLCIGAAGLTAFLVAFTAWSLYRTHRQNSSKVHIGDPEAVVLPDDRIRDAARAQANLNISKILAETHMRTFTEGR